MTDGTIDSDDQIVDPAFARKALAEWYDTGANVRQMHATTLPPAGKGILLESRPDGEYVRTKVVEPTAKALVENEVYTGYSVGIARPKIERDARARGGRITGGKIVEISLVDRPANPMAKFAVLKAEGKNAPLAFVGKVVAVSGQDSTTSEEFVTDAQKKAARKAAKCMKCKGSGFYRKAECIECGGTGSAQTEDAAPAEVVTDKPAGHEGEHAKPSDIEVVFADEESEDEEPVEKSDDAEESEDEEEEDDEELADEADAEEASAEVHFPFKKKAHKKGAIVKSTEGWVLYGKKGAILGVHATKAEALDQKRARAAEKRAKESARVAAAVVLKRLTDEKVVKKTTVPTNVPWPLRRAHDYVCAAYSTEAIMEAYPTAHKSDNPAVGANTRAAIEGLLRENAAKYSGKAKDATRITVLTKSLDALDDLLAKTSQSDLLIARDSLHDAFKAANPTFGADGGPSLPTPSLTISAGEFKRPYISEGHQREVASIGGATVQADAHPISADEYSRGPLTEGHARTLASKMLAFHDTIAAYAPDLCRMDANGSFAFDRQPAMPTPASLPNRDDAKPAGRSAFVFGEAGSPVTRSLTQDDFAAALTKALEPATAKIAALEAEVARLSAEPDPSAAPHRGFTFASKSAKVDKAAKSEATQQAGRDKRAAKVEFLMSLVRSGDPAQRISAADRLARMGIDPAVD